MATVVLLRIVGESKTWLKVEVNEQTRDTKYILKSDPNWGITKYDYWIYGSSKINIGGKQQLLREPAGEPTEGLEDFRVHEVFVEKVSGDWVLVEENTNIIGEKGRRGWVRWRDGREILVGCLLNAFKI